MKRRITMLVGSAALLLALAAGVAVAFNAIDCPNASNNRCFGTNGEDVLNGEGETADQRIVAGAGDDTARGGSGNDTIYGGKGDDGERFSGTFPELEGMAGNDYLDGGPGNETEIDGDQGDDTLLGGPGNDGRRNSDGSCDTSDSDGIRGEGGKNTVDGGPGDDCIDAETGEAYWGGDEESIFGGSGNDFIEAQDGVKDTIDCGDGRNDVVSFDEGLDTVSKCEVKNQTADVTSVSSTGTGDTAPGDDDYEESAPAAEAA